MSSTRTPVKRSNRRRRKRAPRRSSRRFFQRALLAIGIAALAMGIGDLSPRDAMAMGAGGGGGGGGNAPSPSGYVQNPSPAASVGPVSLTSFEAGSLIIPMDGCYQRPSFMANQDVEDMGFDMTGDVCNSNSQKDGGQIAAYSLAYRLAMAGIPLHWAIKGQKTGWHDTDFAITRAGGAPVQHRQVGGSLDNRYSGITQIRYMGAPFIVAKDDVATALTLADSLTGICDTGTCMTAVDMHIAQVDFDAPIYSSIASLPKLAIIDVTGKFQSDDTNKLQGSITEALMNDLSGTLFHVVTFDQVRAGELADQDYALAWVPPFNKPAASTAVQTEFFDKIDEWVDDGGNVLYQDGGVTAMEGEGSLSGDMNYQMDQNLDGNGPSNAWDNCSSGEITGGEDYSDPASQFGGICWTGIGGSKAYWKPSGTNTFDTGSRRQVFIRSGNFTAGVASFTSDDETAYNMATWRHKDNDTDKGRIYYLGGDHWRRTTSSGFRLLLNTILVHASANSNLLTEAEVARSAPIVAPVDGVTTHFQGTFEAKFPPTAAPGFSGSATDTAWRFPHVQGHLRAIDIADVPATLSQLSTVTAMWDGANGIPAPSLSGCADYFTTGCRTVFSHTVGGRNPDKVFLQESTAVQLKPYLDAGLSDAAVKTLVSRVLAGQKDANDNFVPALGGIDRSTMAVVEPSTTIGNARPTMIYAGGRDGMLHAFCADDVGPCQKGTELWAFIPRQQLGLLKNNSAVVDGSPTVTDAFGDFDADGRGEMRTVLTFQTGSGDANSTHTLPAVYALDITDPTQPQILWERVAKATPATGSGTQVTSGALALGAGISTSMAPVVTPSGVKHLTYVTTNNGGTGGAGAYLEALDTSTGEPLWSIGYIYPAARQTQNADAPASAMPGGAAVFSSSAFGESTADTVAVTTIYGDLYIVDAKNGSNKFGTGPLFRFSNDYTPIGAPPTIYRDSGGVLNAIVVSGGYADNSGTSWSPSDQLQYAVSIKLNLGVGAAGTDEGTVVTQSRGWAINLGAGRRAYAQAVVAGGELFIVTDSQDVNLDTYGQTTNTGLLQRFSLAAPTSPIETVMLGGGGSAIDVHIDGTQGTSVAAGGSTIAGGALSNFDSNGDSVSLLSQKQGTRLLWVQAN